MQKTTSNLLIAINDCLNAISENKTKSIINSKERDMDEILSELTMEHYLTVQERNELEDYYLEQIDN